MKILNLYAGIGGNRKLWGEEHKITAVEYTPEIARAYQDHFPNDEIVIGDAHQYLLDNHKNFDFIWSSPPCPTHSRIKKCGVLKGQDSPVYPDMTLYQEIIFLQHFHRLGSGYVVENVRPYYSPLIPALQRDRHLFWSNFYIPELPKEISKHNSNPLKVAELLGFKIDGYNFEKRKVMRNCVMPEVGKIVLDSF